MAHQERVNIAVFIDFDNIEIGVKTTLGEHFDIGVILEALKERGEVVTKIAYADWTRAGEYSRALTQHAIRLVQRNLTPGGDKNGADINLALDALEMAFTHPHINAYVIVGGDSDFLSLVEKLKQYDKKVFVVGGRAFTSIILQRNCHEFIAYENLVRKPAVTRRPARHADRHGADRAGVSDRAARAQDSRGPRGLAADRTAQEHAAAARLDLLGTELRRLVVSRLHREARAGRTGAVEALGPQRHGRAQSGVSRGRRRRRRAVQAAAVRRRRSASMRRRSPISRRRSASCRRRRRPRHRTSRRSRTRSRPQAQHPPLEMPSQLGDNAEGVRVAAQVLSNATSARWPMYLRNVKQILRADSYDERRYGFAGLIELLRACQRDGLVRLERDRRGGLRVFQGPALVRGTTAPPRVEPAEAASPYQQNRQNGQERSDRRAERRAERRTERRHGR